MHHDYCDFLVCAGLRPLHGRLKAAPARCVSKWTIIATHRSPAWVTTHPAHDGTLVTDLVNPGQRRHSAGMDVLVEAVRPACLVDMRQVPARPRRCRRRRPERLAPPGGPTRNDP